MEKRRFINQLPAIHQTETLKKFFGSTVDQVFQQGRSEPITGYIGNKPPYNDPKQDFYISEPSALRQAHQLEPTMVSTTRSAVTDVLFYDDFINYLKTNNANVSRHDRLFDDRYYSWAPPIDIDKVNNHQRYFWFGDNPTLVPAIKLVAEYTITVADGTENEFPLPDAVNGVSASRETHMAFADDFPTVIEYASDGMIRFARPPEAGTIVHVYRYGDLRKVLDGQTAFDPRPFTTETRVSALTSSMRVEFEDALKHRLSGFDVRPFEGATVFASISEREIMWDYDLFTGSYWVEGVGTSIKLVSVNLEPDADVRKPMHVCIDRRSRDWSPWARNNFWVHLDAFSWNEDVDFRSRGATRPIIEFVANLKLFDYGVNRREDVVATLSGDMKYCPVVIETSTNPEISDWDVLLLDKQGYESSGLISYPVHSANSKLLGTLWVDKQRPLTYGARILVLDNSDPDIRHRILTVRTGPDIITSTDYGNGDVLPVTPVAGTVMVIDISEAAKLGDIVRMKKRGPVPFEEGKLGFDNYEWDFSSQSIEWHFDGTSWNEAQSRSLYTNTDPLFSLYTEDHEAHESFEDSTFAGNRVFGFATGASGIEDSVLGRVVRHNASGQITFEQDLVTRRAAWEGKLAEGYQYYRISGVDASGDVYGNSWHEVEAISEQVMADDGFWEPPLNLAANADNQEVSFISRNEWFDHFSALVSSQDGFVGKAIATNNWRDTARDLSLGRRIVQHRSPALKAMLLAADSRFDFFEAARFVEQEYSRFRNKFSEQVLEFVSTGAIGLDQTADVWVEAVLRHLNRAKSQDFAFSLSRVGGTQSFIPPTAACLGLLPPVEPRIVLDDTYAEPLSMLVGHDGSRTPLFGDIRDIVMLALEQRIYRNIPAKFKTETAFDFFDLLEGRSRPAADDRMLYTRQEVEDILTPYLMRWVQINGFDHRNHESYDAGNPFTWNYRDILDKDGVKMPGNWRAIYRWFFDTDRPHLAPWEMLGFASQPTWWEEKYGPAPYTSGNTVLWDDMRDGRIADGARAGIDARFVRPDLWSILPVDANGKLRDPIATGIIPQGPVFAEATREWVAGDHGPVENLWVNSPSYAFTKAMLGALLRPTQFIEYGWDTLRRDLKNGQWINSLTNDRPRHAKLLVHGELNLQGHPISIPGVQQWIVEHMRSKTMNPLFLGSAVRGLSVHLAHKMGGFTHAEDLRIFADNFGILPKEDIKVMLHQAPPYRTTFYSGIIIEWVGNGWSVVGYDNATESFTVMPGDEGSLKHTIALADTPPVYNWLPNVYYPVNRLVEYKGAIYLCVSAHTSGQSFEDEFWKTQPGTQQQYPKVTVYDRGTGETEKVRYNTVFSTYQQVGQFIRDYFRWLEAEGFVFEDIDPKTGNSLDWRSCIKDFLGWAQMQWEPGNFIALSPAASSLKFISKHGTVYNIEESNNGIYGLIDRTGRSMSRIDTFVSRLDEETKIISRNNDLYGARLRLGEIEHVVLFSNRTIFNDLIYDPLLNIRQPRLKLLGMIAREWHGRLDAPGYLVDGSDLVANFDTASENIRLMYDVEKSEDRAMRDHARHVIGFEPRSYLDNLLISNTQQFEYFQGMIHSKGTVGSFERLSRTNVIANTRKLEFHEEWAIKKATFGAIDNLDFVRFRLTSTDVHSNPQLVEFGRNREFTATIGLMPNDSRWIERPGNLNAAFPYVFNQDEFPDFSDALDERGNDLDGFDPIPVPGGAQVQQFTKYLPTAGYVRRDEVDLAAFRTSLINRLYFEARNSPNFFRLETRVWNYDRGDGTFEVLNGFQIGSVGNSLRRIVTPKEDPTLDVGTVRLIYTLPHDLLPSDEGLAFVVTGPTWTENDLEGMHFLKKVETRFAIILDAFVTEGYDYTGAATDLGPISPMPAPETMILRSVRFRNRASGRNFWRRFIPYLDQTIYVDNADDAGHWGVYKWDGLDWKLYRQQPPKIDNERISGACIYDTRTEVAEQTITPEPVSLNGINVLDPVAGLIPGIVDKELTYKGDADPAQYFEDSDALWGADQVGLLWWNTSTMRVLEVETDTLASGIEGRSKAEMDYRAANWGMYAPGSSIDIYEWTRSYVHPFDYATIGQVLNPENPNFIAVSEYHPQKMNRVAVYYFWVRNPTTIPQIPGRSVSATQVSAWIENPKPNDFPWIAAIAPNAILVGGIEKYLNSNSSVLEIKIRRAVNENNVHAEWQLVRPGDTRTPPPDEAWDAMRNSLTGFDDLGQAVPDPNLAVSDSIGMSIRPRRTLFPGGVNGRRRARYSFISKVNELLATRNLLASSATPLEVLSEQSDPFKKLLWSQGAMQDYIVPPPRNSWDFIVSSIAERDELVYTTKFGEFDAFVNQRKPRVLVANLAADVPAWSVWEVDVDQLDGVVEDAFTLASNYDVEAATYEKALEMIADGAVLTGQRILIRSILGAEGFWSVWSYNTTPGASANSDGLVFQNAQLYRCADFFERVDWYADGYSARNAPIISYPTLMARDAAEGLYPTNTFVRIDNDGKGAFNWSSFEDGVWRTVAHQGGTIRLSDAFFEAGRVQYGLSSVANLVDIKRRDGSWELRVLINLLRHHILSVEELNSVFFTMVHYMHSQGVQLPWAFKTSFMSILGHSERVSQTPVQPRDDVNNLLNYVDEVKPYRVKVREYSQLVEMVRDTANVQMRDFDMPLYWDKARKKYRVLNPNVTSDMYIIQTEQPFKTWYDKHLLDSRDPADQDFNPIRTMKVKMRFDRIDPRPDQPLEVGYGWDYLDFDGYQFDDSYEQIEQGGSAFSRMLAFYQPTNGMRENSAKTLLKLGFRGVLVEGGDLFAATIPGDLTEWDIRAFDTLSLEEIIPTEQDVEIDAQEDDQEVVYNGATAAHQLHDPLYGEWHPEELITTGGTEAISVRVHTESTPGAPSQSRRSIVKTSGSNTISVSVDVVPANSKSVIVYVNGVRALASAISIDAFARKVIVNTGSTAQANVLVYVFGPAGLTGITEQKMYEGDGGASFELLHAPSGGNVEVVVNGVILQPSDYTVVGTTVTLDTAPASGADVMINVRAYLNGSASAETATYLHTQSLSGASQSWTLQAPSAIAPQHLGTMLEINGLRALPPFTRYGHFDAKNRAVPFKTITDVSDLKVYLDGELYEDHIALLQSGSVAEGTFDAGYDGNFDNTSFDSLSLWDVEGKIAVIDDYICAIHSSLNAKVVIGVAYDDSHDYNVVGGVLEAIVNVNSGDRVEATSFDNDDYVNFQTNVFKGVSNGEYVIDTRANDFIVALDGEVLRPDADYTVASRNVFDRDFMGDALSTTQRYRVIKLTGSQTDGQRLVVMSIGGRKASIEGDWAALSARPGLSMMGEMVYDQNATIPKVVTSAKGSRNVYKMQGSWDICDWSELQGGTLVNAITPTSESIQVTLTGNVNPFPEPDLEFKRPGAIWINGERIEYFVMENTEGTVVFSELRRGTRGTATAVETRTVLVEQGDGTTTQYVLPNATIASPLDVMLIDEDNVSTNQHVAAHYTMAQSEDDVVVTMLTAPAANVSIAIGQSGTFEHPVGSSVNKAVPNKVLNNIPFQLRDPNAAAW